MPADGETLAVLALGHIAADPERLGDFLAATGLTAAEIRSSAGHPAFALGMLAYVLGHEAVLAGLAAAHGFDPDALAQRLTRLAGAGRDGSD